MSGNARPYPKFVARLRSNLLKGGGGAESTTDVLAGIEELLAHPNRYAFPSLALAGLPVMAGLGMFVLMVLCNSRVAVIVTALGTMGAFLGTAIQVSEVPFRLRRAMAGRLAAVDDVAAVPLIVKLMQQVHVVRDSSQSASVPQGEEFRNAALNLYRLMCRMPKVEALRIVQANRWWFYAAMTDVYNLGANTSVIKGQAELIRQLADVDARPQVAKLARAEAATPHERQARAIAQELLPELDALIEKQKPGKVLLRPVDSSILGPEGLLRPASSNGSAQGDSLLKPSVAPNANMAISSDE